MVILRVKHTGEKLLNYLRNLRFFCFVFQLKPMPKIDDNRNGEEIWTNNYAMEWVRHESLALCEDEEQSELRPW